MNLNEAQARITENVQKLMGVRGYFTQQALGERIGKRKAEMSGRMNGRTSWTLPDLLMLADALDVEPGMLLVPLKVSVEGLAATGTDGGRVTVAPAVPTDAALPTIQASNDCKTPANTPRVQVVGDFHGALSPTSPPPVRPVADLATYRARRAGDSACASAAS